MKILLVRHGQTDWNKLGKMIGKQDKPLNETGLTQAETIRETLQGTHIDLIICSPLKRTQQTANIINRDRNIPILYDARISERDYGEFENLTSRDYDIDDYWDYYKNIRYQQAENIQDFFNRVYAFFEDVVSKYPGKTVLIVTHGGVSRVAGCYFANEIPKGSLVAISYHLDNCQVARYEK